MAAQTARGAAGLLMREGAQGRGALPAGFLTR